MDIKQLSVAACAVLALAGCSNTDEEEVKYKGESLFQPMPLPEGSWERFTHIYPDAKRVTWGRVGKKDVLEVVTFPKQKRGDLEKYRAFHDQKLEQACNSFSSKLFDTVVRNGYTEMLWQTSCLDSESEVARFSFHLSVSGNDAFYVLSRKWVEAPTEASKNAWLDYFSEVYVCDDRLPQSPCED
ncbi:hypothetical protein ACFSJ3_01715 [Corallincola platygyrae]|uniref:Lipoprotein n=1 Tax=Corallincola platygyrae TaxID=1193278 RepID=A0ABW4XGP9_9GAMM